MIDKILTPTTAACKTGSIQKPLSHFAIIICILLFTVCEAAAQYSQRIVSVDDENFPNIRVHISITDPQGNHIPDNQSVKLSLLEDGKVVSEETLSNGWTASIVLVLDVSGSMGKDGKLDAAKEAATRYIKMAPSNYQIAVVRFSDPVTSKTPRGVDVVGDFKDTRDTLCDNINGLSPKGNTALQDGIGKALELLSGRPDRKEIVVLTDGQENKSANPLYAKYDQLIRLAKNRHCTISPIGLGWDVKTEYLKGYEDTGGTYLFAPDATKLQEMFDKAIKRLESEKVMSYRTSREFADGAWRKLQVELKVGSDSPYKSESGYSSPGFLPHIPGDHTRWFILVLAFLSVPPAVLSVRNFASARHFRSSHLVRMNTGAAAFGKEDINGMVFGKGSIVVKCPGCDHLHHIRSWRLNCCTCMYNRGHEAKYCYHRKYPRWLRHGLDRLSGKRSNEAGRAWLCRCAGDKDGY